MCRIFFLQNTIVSWLVRSIKGDPMGRKRVGYMNERDRRKTLFFTTNLATTVDVYSKSTLMTMLFDAIVDKQTT